MGRGERPAEIAGLHRLDKRQQYRHVLRKASGHHAVYGDILDRYIPLRGRNLPQRCFRRKIGEFQELCDSTFRRQVYGLFSGIPPFRVAQRPVADTALPILFR